MWTKTKITKLSILLLIPLLILAAGCQSGSAGSETPITTGTITIENFQVEPPSHIAASGVSDLPDRACLATQLYENDEAIDWWPASDCIRVSNGKWQVMVSLGTGGVPDELSQQAKYSFEIWYQENPSIKADPFRFDLSGPHP